MHQKQQLLLEQLETDQGVVVQHGKLETAVTYKIGHERKVLRLAMEQEWMIRRTSDLWNYNICFSQQTLFRLTRNYGSTHGILPVSHPRQDCSGFTPVAYEYSS